MDERQWQARGKGAAGVDRGRACRDQGNAEVGAQHPGGVAGDANRWRDDVVLHDAAPKASGDVRKCSA